MGLGKQNEYKLFRPENRRLKGAMESRKALHFGMCSHSVRNVDQLKFP